MKKNQCLILNSLFSNALQYMLIGSSCLALTDKERSIIENFNFDNYQHSTPVRSEIASIKAHAIAKAQITGVVSGFLLGSIIGVVVAWNNWHKEHTLAGGLSGGITGGATGYYAGKEIGQKRIMKKLSNSTEYQIWKNKNYETTIFPALSRYIDPDQWDRMQLTCPITLDFMIEPVKAEDGHVYEKAALLSHLNAWDRRQEQIELERVWRNEAPLSSQERLEVLQTRSPLRNGNITITGLEELPGYYQEIFEILKRAYNNEVLKQRTIFARTELPPQPFSEEVSKVVRFYEKTQRERSIIANDMHTSILRSPVLSDKESEVAQEFLNAAAKLPRLLN